MLTGTVNKWLAGVALALLVACALLSFGVTQLYGEYQAKAHDHSVLVGKIEQQKAQTATEIARLTAERDKRQEALDLAYREREVSDALAKQEIDRLNRAYESKPVRVRYVVSGCSGGSCDGPGSEAAANSDDSSGNPATAYGVLHPESARSFKQLMAEVERINSAYASCRADLAGRIGSMRSS